MDIYNLLTTMKENYIVEKLSSQTQGRNNEFLLNITRNGKVCLENVINQNQYSIRCNLGATNWADIPHFNILNSEITSSAKEGIYVVYLFDMNIDHVYLCQGQGVTAIEDEFKKRDIIKKELIRRSALIKQRVPEYEDDFSSEIIDLKYTGDRVASYYPPAVAYSKKYDLNNLPNNEVLEHDLLKIISLYEKLIFRGGVDDINSVLELNDQNENTSAALNIEEKRKYYRHFKIERNSKTSKRVKQIHGYECQGCSFDFEKTYGERGKEYIEAHHLIPLSSLPEGQTVSMDPREDFAVLCSNCHRIVHRKKNHVLTLEELRNIDGVKKIREIHEQSNNQQRILT